MSRIRMRFTKHGKVRFTSHRDVARLWERALRRAQIPVASTEGFSPRPRMHFGLALPTGGESLGEYIDIDLREDETVDVDALPLLLSPLFPEGIDVALAAEVDRRGMSLQEAVTSCTWRIRLPAATAAEVAAGVDALAAADEIWVQRERKGKPRRDDIREAVRSVVVADEDVVVAELGTQPRGVRLGELLSVLGVPMDAAQACRTHQWIESDGARREPLPDDATRREPSHDRTGQQRPSSGGGELIAGGIQLARH